MKLDWPGLELMTDVRTTPANGEGGYCITTLSTQITGTDKWGEIWSNLCRPSY